MKPLLTFLTLFLMLGGAASGEITTKKVFVDQILKKLEEKFEIIDSNKDGFMSGKEEEDYLIKTTGKKRKLSKNYLLSKISKEDFLSEQKKKVEKNFNIKDINKDGILTEEEEKHFATSEAEIADIRLELQKIADTNKDGRVTAEESTSLLKKIDTNKDGTATLDEQKFYLSLTKNIELKKNNINYLKYIEQCKFIGFKQNTEKMGECVLRFYEADVKITLLGKEGKDVNSGDVLTNLLILDQSLKLLNPPKKNFKCQARPFGTITNINCQ